MRDVVEQSAVEHREVDDPLDTGFARQIERHERLGPNQTRNLPLALAPGRTPRSVLEKFAAVREMPAQPPLKITAAPAPSIPL